MCVHRKWNFSTWNLVVHKVTTVLWRVRQLYVPPQGDQLLLPPITVMQQQENSVKSIGGKKRSRPHTVIRVMSLLGWVCVHWHGPLRSHNSTDSRTPAGWILPAATFQLAVNQLSDSLYGNSGLTWHSQLSTPHIKSSGTCKPTLRADWHYASRFRSVTVPSTFRQNGLFTVHRVRSPSRTARERKPAIISIKYAAPFVF
jgi:hypothetical protein